MSDFAAIWHFLNHRQGTIATVQNHDELKHIYDLVLGAGCHSYLEVGTAEGNSLYTIGHALQGLKPSITYVDYGEKHTQPLKDEVVNILKSRKIFIREVLGDSHNHQIIKDASILAPFDVVLIDGGHETHDITADLMMYAPMARRFLVVHDIQLPAVGKVFDWYCQVQGLKKVRKFITSPTFGYGIAEMK